MKRKKLHAQKLPLLLYCNQLYLDIYNTKLGENIDALPNLTVKYKISILFFILFCFCFLACQKMYPSEENEMHRNINLFFFSQMP